MEPTSQPQKKNEVEQFGGIFGIVLVVVLLAAGGIYFLLQQQAKIQHDQEELQAPANS
jgi:uncharacterized protein HemX